MTLLRFAIAPAVCALVDHVQGQPPEVWLWLLVIGYAVQTLDPIAREMYDTLYRGAPKTALKLAVLIMELLPFVWVGAVVWALLS